MEDLVWIYPYDGEKRPGIKPQLDELGRLASKLMFNNEVDRVNSGGSGVMIWGALSNVEHENIRSLLKHAASVMPVPPMLQLYPEDAEHSEYFALIQDELRASDSETDLASALAEFAQLEVDVPSELILKIRPKKADRATIFALLAALKAGGDPARKAFITWLDRRIGKDLVISWPCVNFGVGEECWPKKLLKQIDYVGLYDDYALVKIGLGSTGLGEMPISDLRAIFLAFYSALSLTELDKVWAKLKVRNGDKEVFYFAHDGEPASAVRECSPDHDWVQHY